MTFLPPRPADRSAPRPPDRRWPPPPRRAASKGVLHVHGAHLGSLWSGTADSRSRSHGQTGRCGRDRPGGRHRDAGGRHRLTRTARRARFLPPDGRLPGEILRRRPDPRRLLQAGKPAGGPGNPPRAHHRPRHPAAVSRKPAQRGDGLHHHSVERQHSPGRDRGAQRHEPGAALVVGAVPDGHRGSARRPRRRRIRPQSDVRATEGERYRPDRGRHAQGDQHGRGGGRIRQRGGHDRRAALRPRSDHRDHRGHRRVCGPARQAEVRDQGRAAAGGGRGARPRAVRRTLRQAGPRPAEQGSVQRGRAHDHRRDGGRHRRGASRAGRPGQGLRDRAAQPGGAQADHRGRPARRWSRAG
ncbi:MAG: hypothetical protein BWZ08_01016 [candidate division BRC1 bacterium ADurb.BinA292]|nr:MAG: hypothetical protein BWZ08_01016 [candidate division BRC1 bacterium ADurb.BinA292]